MMDVAIETVIDPFEDSKVYGVPVAEYTVNGVEGCSFMEAVAFGALRQSHGIEQVSIALEEVVKLRQKKASDLGDALATLVEALGTMPKDVDPDKTSTRSVSAKLVEANRILKEYGIPTMTLQGKPGEEVVTYAQCYTKQNDVQVEVDTANNDLQQDMVMMQGLVTKRDNAFSVANKIVDRTNKTAQGTISAIGS